MMRRLLDGDWSAPVEAELFANLPRLVRLGVADAARRSAAAADVRALAAGLYEGRLEAELGPAAEREKLTRAERRERERRARRSVRAALQARFAGELPAALDPGMARRIVSALKPLGFRWVSLDLEGYRTGSLNETLPIAGQP